MSLSGDPDADGPRSLQEAPGRRLQTGPQQQQLPTASSRDEHRLRLPAVRVSERPGDGHLHQR